MGYSTAITKLKMWYLTIYVGCVRRQKSYWRFVAKLGIGYSDTNVLFRVPQNIYSGNKKIPNTIIDRFFRPIQLFEFLWGPATYP